MTSHVSAAPDAANGPRSVDPVMWAELRQSAMKASASPASRSEHAASVLARLAERTSPGARLGTKLELRELCGVSVGTFNEAVKLAHSRGYVISRPGVGGGIFAAEQSPMVRLGNSVLALDGSATSVADAVRMRDALDPLLVEDALWHSSPADLRAMRESLAVMEEGIANEDSVTFVKGNWALHACIAAVSPNAILRSVYVSLLELIEAHTLDVKASETTPLGDYIQDRFDLHRRLIDAIEDRDHELALALIADHSNTAQTGGDAAAYAAD